MRILEIEKLFQTEDTLNEVLDACQEDFGKIDYWSQIRKENITNNSTEVDKALNELSGSYSNLRTVLGIAVTEKQNRHCRFKESLRIDIENEGGKYVDSKAETQASASVAEYRRIRNIINAYVESCDKHIITLQSILKDIGKDYNHKSE